MLIELLVYLKMEKIDVKYQKILFKMKLQTFWSGVVALSTLYLTFLGIINFEYEVNMTILNKGRTDGRIDLIGYGHNFPCCVYFLCILKMSN